MLEGLHLPPAAPLGRQAAEHAVWRPRSAFSRHTGQTETTRRPSVGVRTPPERVSGMERVCDMADQPASRLRAGRAR
jgi:hypothetical protein